MGSANPLSEVTPERLRSLVERGNGRAVVTSGSDLKVQDSREGLHFSLARYALWQQ